MQTTTHKITSAIVRFFSKRPTILSMAQLDFAPPHVFVANHERLAGPIMMNTYFPVPCRPWIIDKLLNPDEITAYVGETFFSGRLRMKEKISHTCAKMLTPLIEKVMNSADPIPVYRETMRIKETFQLSIEALEKSHNLLIFPEKKGSQLENFKHVFQFNTGFIHLARQYFKETKKVLHFVPVSINPNVRTIAIGTAIQYDPSNAYDEEKHRLCHYLMDQIENLYEPSPKRKKV